VFDALWTGEGSEVDAVIEAKGLKQMNDTGALEKIIDEVIAANPDNVEQYKRRQGQGLQRPGRPGDEGQQGQGQPAAGNELLKARLA
jgi:aspartyl-tRNA(Asn)/glutamyl-tRNA(Gln) amidotransferase subunit B